jgi:hypothetical protein
MSKYAMSNEFLINNEDPESRATDFFSKKLLLNTLHRKLFSPFNTIAFLLI